MRTLVVSLGNTSVFAGVFANGRQISAFRLPLADASTARALAKNFPRKVRGRIDAAVMCSVVPKLTPLFAKEIQRRWKIAPRRLTAASVAELKVAYRNPSELGTDRIAAALGAREVIGPRDVIIVDCGTATTVTALRKDGTILGGAIFPGLGLWPAMLATRTAQLPEVSLRLPKSAIGRSPRESLQSGIVHGHAGAVRALVTAIAREQFGRKKPLVIGTGGNARWLKTAGLFSQTIPNLVLIGLARFGKVAASPTPAEHP